MNLFLLICVVVCLIIMNSFTYKNNSFYLKITEYNMFTDEINSFKLELNILNSVVEFDYFDLNMRIKQIN